MVSDTRTCEHCGTIFVPRREHARFCSTSCRITWNRERKGGEPGVEVTALDWTIAAMCDVLEWLWGAGPRDRSQVFAVIGEAVWWVTIVDATLIRYHLEAYEAVMADRSPADRRLIEGTFGGLRFVRNQMGYYVDQAEFIDPGPGPSGSGDHDGDGDGDADGGSMAWSWRSVPEPALTLLPPRGQAWEMERYQAYQTHLAGHSMAEVFGLASAFLRQVSAKAAFLTAAAPPDIRAV